MSKRSRKARQQARRREQRRFSSYVTSPEAASLSRTPDYRQWPIVGAYVPLDDCFRATGVGTAGVLRRQPDGSLICAFFTIVLNDGGLREAFGQSGTAPEQAEELVRSLSEIAPPCEPGPAALAARYIWGAYAWALNEGCEFPDELNKHYLRMVPLLSGTRNWWLQQLIGPDGLVPSRLIEVIRANEPTHELPDDKEIVILTKMTFDLSDRSATLEILRAAAPEFTSEGTDESGVEWFDWSREYPRNHWSPFRLLGGRQSLGSVRIAQDTLIAEARTLTMAAMLVAKLKTRLAEKIRLRDTVWRGADELLAELQDDLDEDSDD